MAKIRVQCTNCGDKLPITDCWMGGVVEKSGDMVLEVQPCKNCTECIKLDYEEGVHNGT